MFSGNLSVFKSLFHGREDIFARRWEKSGKSTYFPSYDFDPYQFRLHKMKGGTIQAFLESQPANFSRILHDYSDEHKGFILWKDLLTERVV
jgi:hypothetical protein